ncbi:pectinesterase family protein [Uliginosibacterium sp. H3]|uniref:Pectinesterase n=1 Tax=Uliginosibacterium silvisoli TaxID=3114758 RepID=A0ABU6K730_9RHOO|nr:pectinesterase family protein [Uliginosibacterium sp. H3]
MKFRKLLRSLWMGAPVLACSLALASTSTATRPQLSSSEAASYTVSTFLNGWAAGAVSTTTGNYVVCSSCTYTTVQAAVNAAINAGGSTRKYIQIKAGTYTGLVVIPSGTPLTIYGDSETGVVLQLGANYAMTGAAFKTAVGNSSNFGSSAPSTVQSYYNDCTTRSTLQTNCTATVVSYASNLNIKNLTIKNSYGENNSAANGQHQAVAYLNNGGDQVTLDTVKLIGNQDTLWLAGTGKRTYIRNSYIEGDVDFIFGDMTGIFDGCEIHYTNARTSTGVIAAPSHPSANKGFIFSGGSFTTSGGTNTVSFARQWPQHGSTTGQVIIRGANIGAHIKTAAPWMQWSSSYAITYGSSGNRRLAEYSNTGSGAAP